MPNVTRVLDLLQRFRIKPHENELRFVRKLVDKGKLSHSWLPVDPEANVKRVRHPRGSHVIGGLKGQFVFYYLWRWGVRI